MSGLTIHLTGRSARDRAKALIDKAPDGAVVSVKEANRTDPQNAKMWAMLTDIALAKPGGRVMRPDLWKCVFMAEAGHKPRFEHSLHGDDVICTGFRSSRLTVGQMAELITCIQAFGDQSGVKWSIPLR